MSKHDKRAARFGRDHGRAMRHHEMFTRRLIRYRRGPVRRRINLPIEGLLVRDWMGAYRPRRALTPESEQ